MSPPKQINVQVRPKLWLCMIGAVLLCYYRAREVAEIFLKISGKISPPKWQLNEKLLVEDVYFDKWAL